ncbi:MAG: TetR family transcriptional regulator, partial [Nonlabens sp.]
MRDPEHTKATILKESANLFNAQGYKATSLSDITTATGLTKGAIYKHFKNKEDLEQ